MEIRVQTNQKNVPTELILKANIALLTAMGKTVAEIAEELKIPEHMVIAIEKSR